jgi:hypothetical protein
MGHNVYGNVYLDTLLRLRTSWDWCRYVVISPPRIGCRVQSANRLQGTLAAAFQSYMYGAFTPAGGIFATLTSMAMLGTLMPPAAILAAVIATGAAIIVWVLGIGRP